MRLRKSIKYEVQKEDIYLKTLDKPSLEGCKKVYTKRKKRRFWKGYNQGRWSDLEHNEFLKAFKLHNNDWKSIERKIKSRSSTQIRSHAQKLLVKLMKKYEINQNDTIKNIFKLKQIIEDVDKPYFEAFRIFCFKKIFKIEKIPKILSLRVLIDNETIDKLNSFITDNQESSDNFSERLYKSNSSNFYILRKNYINDKYLISIEDLIQKEIENLYRKTNEFLAFLLNNSIISFESLLLDKSFKNFIKGNPFLENVNFNSKEIIYINNYDTELNEFIISNEQLVKEFYEIHY